MLAERFSPGGPWFTTSAGTCYHLLDPRPEDISIEWVAHHLSLENRWCGATRLPISVGQHSLLVLSVFRETSDRWIQRRDPHLQKIALLHDAVEAVLKDIPSPLKRCAEMAGYRVLERRHWQCFAQKFGLPLEIPAVVKAADKIAEMIERRDLLAHNPQWIDPLGDIRNAWKGWPKIEPLEPEEIERRFLQCFRKLEVAERLALHTVRKAGAK
jgi:5'-deoxynucleotidase YfbR-like HD superfamily hydrolase